jgi:2-polyprenyl-6-methoxyphenol hydroxylase-like FAD-dependent oxidoreductase
VPETSAPSVQTVSCCVVGGGPAGVLLAYLLARNGIKTLLLESQKNFNRDFRGDTFHASSLEIIDQLGLLPKLEHLIRAKLPRLTMTTPSGKSVVMGNFDRMKSKFPYVAIVPQSDFLDAMVAEAQNFPSFQIEMEANAQELIEENGRIVGLRYKKQGEIHEVRSDLVVAADGRGSRLRKAAGIDLIPGEAPPMDVVWFRLPAEPSDLGQVEGVEIRMVRGHLLILVHRGDTWQGGLVILKGGFHDLREAGLPALQASIKEMLPDFLKERVSHINDWKEVSLLSVQVGRVKKWFRPGLLLIGDAAHVMSPVGGVGINYAIQDAVAAHNLLSGPLQQGTLSETDLAAVQTRRERATRVMQRIQTTAQNKIIAAALNSEKEFALPLPLRVLGVLPGLNHLPAHMLAYGLQPERVRLPAAWQPVGL